MRDMELIMREGELQHMVREYLGGSKLRAMVVEVVREELLKMFPPADSKGESMMRQIAREELMKWRPPAPSPKKRRKVTRRKVASKKRRR